MGYFVVGFLCLALGVWLGFLAFGADASSVPASSPAPPAPDLQTHTAAIEGLRKAVEQIAPHGGAKGPSVASWRVALINSKGKEMGIQSRTDRRRGTLKIGELIFSASKQRDDGVWEYRQIGKERA